MFTRLKLPVAIASLFCLVSFGAENALAQTIRYVDAAATGAADGSSWCDAFVHLQDALAVAVAGDTIRVADGTYRPDRSAANPAGTGDRAATFQLMSGVEILGGYAGCGPPNPDLRDLVTHETILSGDLAGNDDPGEGPPPSSTCCYDHSTPGCDDDTCETTVCSFDPFCCAYRWDSYCTEWVNYLCCTTCPSRCDNSFHVTSGHGTDAATVLDGVTIARGSAVDASPVHRGGGLIMTDGSPTIRDCTFLDNRASGAGGAIYMEGGAPTMANCQFLKNTTIYFDESFPLSAGAIYNRNGHLTLAGCWFRHNSAARQGGGLFNDGGTATLRDCTFSGNAALMGGGIYQSFQPDGTLLLINCVFSGNSGGGPIYDAAPGGGMEVGSGVVTLINCTFSENTSNKGGGASISVYSGDVYASNSIFWGPSTVQFGIGGPYGLGDGTIVADHSCIVPLWDGGVWEGIGNVAVDPLFVDARGADGVAGTEDDDLRLMRQSPVIDAGDNDAVPPSVTTDIAGDPRIVDADLDGVAEVDMGAYEAPRPADCNDNGTPDEDDLAAGTSEDCNGNGIPDECDPDSDGDGRIDACDGCPADPNKVEPGLCGCGLSDTADADGDGTSDCVDVCPGVDDAVFAPDCAAAIPALAEWGLVILALLLLTGGKICFGHRSPRGATC